MMKEGKNMNIVIGADKGGFYLKEAVADMLREHGHNITDAGTLSLERPCTYTITAQKAAGMIQNGKADKGLLFCGTGMGMSMVANKFKGVYAAVVESVYAAEYCRKINNANILCMGGFIIGETMAKDMVRVFLDTNFVQDFPDWRVEFLTEQKKLMEELENKMFK